MQTVDMDEHRQRDPSCPYGAGWDITKRRRTSMSSKTTLTSRSSIRYTDSNSH